MRLLIGGGGTGGHLFPGMAIADEVKRRGGEVLFVGSARGIEARVLPKAGYAVELLTVSGLVRMGPVGLLRGLARVPLALVRAARIVRRFRPDVVLGVGGYASGPVLLAAALMRRPIVVQEQNSVPGKTNRFFGRLARVVFTAFEDAAAFFPAGRVVNVGNPVRSAFLEAAAAGDSAGAGSSGVLVVGGSQGARAVNELILGAAEILAARNALPLLTHQTGTADLDRCRQRYEALGLQRQVTVQAFIEDMAAAYRSAALVVGRAGALTLAELALCARPAVLLPLPTAADDHQSKNAAAFASAGAACVLDQRQIDAAALADRIQSLLAAPSERAAMADAMGRLARPTAAGEIVNHLERLLGVTNSASRSD